MASMIRVDDDILHENHEPALGGADGEEQVDHPDDFVIGAHHEDPAAVGLFQDETEALFLFGPVGLEIRLDPEQFHDEFDEGVKLTQGGGFDTGEIGQCGWHEKGGGSGVGKFGDGDRSKVRARRKEIQFLISRSGLADWA